jgi:hypothetical protein
MKSGDSNMRRGRALAHHLWIPTALLVLGVLSTAMLVWTSLIIGRQGVNYEHIEALKDIQIKTTAFHLRFEEAIARGSRDDMKRTFPDLDAAEKLSHTLLHGGESEHGTPLPPIDERSFRRQTVTRSGTISLNSAKNVRR